MSGFRWTSEKKLENVIKNMEEGEVKEDLKYVLSFFKENPRLFEISESKEKAFDKWRKKLNRKKGEAYVGAAGGAYTFSFIPTGLGTLTSVTRATGETLDLTEDGDIG